MSEETVVKVPVDEAVARLDVTEDYDCGNGPEPCVHTFRETAFGLLGAHWSVEEARAMMEKHGVEESGPAATGMNHGLVVIDENGPVFFETARA